MTPDAPRPDVLPPDLPVPLDDGGAAHLSGALLPSLRFRTSRGTFVPLDEMPPQRWVLFLYPSTGEPGSPIPDGWDQVPGARGCSQEACSFRDNLAELRSLGVTTVLALSSDPAEHQAWLVDRFHLPYPMISDPGLALARELDLPTFEAAGRTLYKRLTMVVTAGRIEHVFYPIFPPDQHGDEVVAWVRAHPAPAQPSS